MKINRFAVVAAVIAIIAAQSYADKNSQMVTTALKSTDTSDAAKAKKPAVPMPKVTVPTTDLKETGSPTEPMSMPTPMEQVKPAKLVPMPPAPVIESPEDKPEPRVPDASSQLMERLDAIEQRLVMIWKALQKYISGEPSGQTPAPEMTPPTPTDLTPSASPVPEAREDVFVEEGIADFGGEDAMPEETTANEADLDLNKIL